MNMVAANVLVREAAKTEIHPLALVVLFCSGGLLAALLMASLGLDLGAGFF